MSYEKMMLDTIQFKNNLPELPVSTIIYIHILSTSSIRFLQITI